MAIALTVSEHGKITVAGTTLSVSFTFTGSSRLVLAGGLVTGSSGDPGALTIKMGGSGGTSPTATLFSTLTNTYYRSWMAYWVNPAEATTNIYLSWANTGKAWTGVSVWSGVDMGTPIGTLKTGNALALTSITCVVGNTIVDLLTGDADGVGTKDALATLIKQNNIDTSGNYGNGNMSYKVATSTSESLTWDLSGNIQVHNAIPLIPASLSGGSDCAILPSSSIW